MCDNVEFIKMDNCEIEKEQNILQNLCTSSKEEALQVSINGLEIILC